MLPVCCWEFCLPGMQCLAQTAEFDGLAEGHGGSNTGRLCMYVSPVGLQLLLWRGLAAA